jgi:hypothetical protein
VLSTVVALLAIITALLGIWQGFQWWKAARVSEVEKYANEFQLFLGDVMAHGGVTQDRYLTDDQKRLEAELTNLARGLHDRKLKQKVEEALKLYRQAFASSHRKVPMIYFEGMVETPQERQRNQEITERRALQHDAAQESYDLFTEVIDRIHQLNRLLIVPRKD